MKSHVKQNDFLQRVYQIPHFQRISRISHHKVGVILDQEVLYHLMVV